VAAGVSKPVVPVYSIGLGRTPRPFSSSTLLTSVIRASNCPILSSMANGGTQGLKRSSTFRNYTHSEPRFRALLTEGNLQVNFDWLGKALARYRIHLGPCGRHNDHRRKGLTRWWASRGHLRSAATPLDSVRNGQ
jgi:hypothetical protein